MTGGRMSNTAAAATPGRHAARGQRQALARTVTLTRAVTLAAAMGLCTGAWAAEDDKKGPETGIPDPSIATSLPMNGDPGGHRARLAERGVTYQLNYIGEVLGNTTGGLSRGTVYDGRLEAVIEADLEKLAGLKGLFFHANGFWIHGEGLSTRHIGNFMAVSNAEALETVRLFELWLEQKFMGDKASVRVGQLAADSEFFISGYAGQFINGTFGWPAYMAADLPNGGPAYPLATPGIRLKLDPTPNLTLLAAVFNGDPAGPSVDPQRANRHGTSFRVQDPALVMAEGQYKYNQDKGAPGLAGTVRLGGWYHFGDFDDQRFGTDGLSLANPLSNRNPLQRGGNWGLYGVIDQQIWRPAGGEPDKGVGVFARVAGSPSDRNLVDFYIDGGIVFSGVVPRRPDDSFGAAFAYARISGDARDFDRDLIAGGAIQPVRDHEAALEINYTAQIVPGWTITPEFQYIWHPGGNVSSTANPASAVGDAVVLGARTVVRY